MCACSVRVLARSQSWSLSFAFLARWVTTTPRAAVSHTPAATFPPSPLSPLARMIAARASSVASDSTWSLSAVAPPSHLPNFRPPCTVAGKLPGLSAKPELRSEALLPEDEFIVLASRGLWAVVEPAEAVRAPILAHPALPLPSACLITYPSVRPHLATSDLPSPQPASSLTVSPTSSLFPCCHQVKVVRDELYAYDDAHMAAERLINLALRRQTGDNVSPAHHLSPPAAYSASVALPRPETP